MAGTTLPMPARPDALTFPAHVQGVEDSAWTIEPGFALALGLAFLVYALAWAAVAGKGSGGEGWPRGRALAWYLGLASLLAAYGGPLEAYSDDSLFVHMLQHLILLQLAPPLLLWGRPLALQRLAFPGLYAGRPGRRPSRMPQPSWRPSQGSIAVLVGLVFNLNLLLWHLPPAYDAALRSERVHAAEHLGFLLSALAFWWIVLRASRARAAPAVTEPTGAPGRDPATVATSASSATPPSDSIEPEPTLAGAAHLAYGLCFAGCMAGMLVALALVFAAEPVYPWYLERPRDMHPLGMDALLDQRIGGLIMFLGGLSYLALLLGLLAREARAR